MKLILYGMGNIFKRYASYVDWSNVIAIADKKNPRLFLKKQIPIICPEEIVQYNCDYIVIFSDLYFENIINELVGNYFISEKKIISWRAFFKKNILMSDKGRDFYKKFIIEHQIYKILDIGMEELSKFFISSKGISEDESLRIDGTGRLKYPIYKNLYHNIYESINNASNPYDLLIVQKSLLCQMNIEELLKLNPVYLILVEGYDLEKKKAGNIPIESNNGYKIKEYVLPDEKLYIFEKEDRVGNIECQIYVVTHKEYNVKNDMLYTPICVGSEYKNEAYLNEHMGENIAELNEQLNECTALYWIWKNTNVEYVGLNHYRRYFYNTHLKNSADYLDHKTLRYILKEKGYEIILPELKLLSVSVYENICGVVGKELGDKAYEAVKTSMERQQHAYLDSFENVMSGNALYRCHMFVTNRSILNEYCEWLFSFILEAARSLDVSWGSKTEKRAIGYYAEAMLTCWLMKQDIKIWELSFTDI